MSFVDDQWETLKSPSAVRDGSESVESVDMSKWKWTQSFQVKRRVCFN